MGTVTGLFILKSPGSKSTGRFSIHGLDGKSLELIKFQIR